MATRQSIMKQGSKGKKLSRSRLRKLAAKAKGEVAGLLQADKKGTITRKKLALGLERVEDNLTVLEIHLLDKVT
jgi:hypothetical protein